MTTTTTTPAVTKPENKTAPVAAPATTTFTTEQLMEIQKVAIATAMAITSAQQPQAAATQNLPNQYVAEECIECRQAATACKGKHVQMVVYPVKYQEFMPWFPGVKINGVMYCSNDASHEITVPACAQSTIVNSINDFEQNEKTILMGRDKVHNSGSIGKKGTGAIHATAAWR